MHKNSPIVASYTDGKIARIYEEKGNVSSANRNGIECGMRSKAQRKP